MLESKYLKENLQNIEKLMTIPSLRRFETDHLGKILRLSKIRQYDDGEVIIKEGESDPWFYFLLDGEILILKNDVEIGRSDKMGELFGEMRIVDEMARSASIRAVGKTTCLAVDTSMAKSLDIDKRAEYLLYMYRIFAEFISTRLRLTNEELFEAKKKIEELKAKLGE